MKRDFYKYLENRITKENNKISETIMFTSLMMNIIILLGFGSKAMILTELH